MEADNNRPSGEPGRKVIMGRIILLFGLLLSAIIINGLFSLYNENQRMLLSVATELDNKAEMSQALYRGRIEAMDIIARIVDERNQVISDFMDYDKIDPVSSMLRTIVTAYDLDMAFLFDEDGVLLTASGTGTQTPEPEIYATLIEHKESPRTELDKIHPAIVEAQLPEHTLHHDADFLAIKSVKHVLHDTGGIYGYMVLVKLINMQQEMAANMAKATGGEIIFHDSYHNVVLTSFPDPVAIFPDSEERALQFRENEYAVKIEPISNFAGRFVGELILAMDKTPFYQKRRASLWSVLPPFFVTALILILLLTFLKTQILDRVTQLIAALHEVARGKLSVRLDVAPSTKDPDRLTELERMSRDFNFMMDRLEQTHREMLAAQQKIEAINEELEDRVRARTAELMESRENLIAEIQAHNEAEEARRNLERRVAQSQKLEAIGTLAGGIAHDFNNILSAIFGYTELSLASTDMNKIHANLTRILEAANRAGELVKQILTFSRQRELEPKPVQIHLIVKEALKLIKASLPATIEIRHDINSDSLVLADPTQIHQVLMNLLTNAGHAMRESGGILHISLSDVTLDRNFASRYPEIRPGDYIKLTVSDTGHGIPREMQDRIFDPFFTTKQEGEGTGMGLAVVHGIVRSCNGIITLYSEPGEGATFTVFLPVSGTGGQQESTGLPDIPGGTGHILIVDDEPDILNISKEMLTLLGYRVTPASDGEEALALFKEDPQGFDLLLTDMTMPRMTGDRLAEEVLAIRPHLPVVISTGYSEKLSEAKIAALGLRGLIMKPVIFRELAVMLHDILAQNPNQ